MIVGDAPRRDADGAARPFFLSALIGCMILVSAMAVLTWISDRQNRAASQAETEAVRAALFAEVRAMSERLQAFAAVTPLSPPSGSILPVPGPFTRLFVVDPTSQPQMNGPGDELRDIVNNLIHREVAPAQDGLRGAFDPDAEPLPEGQRRGDILNIGPRTYLAVVMGTGAGVGDRRHNVDLLALDLLDDDMLARIARAAGTRPLSLLHDKSQAADGATLPMRVGGAGVTFVWAPNTPGDGLFRMTSAVLAVVGALFAAAMLLLSRRMTRTLIASEARAKADAAHDLLTGLNNRSAFYSQLEREMERSTGERGNNLGLLYLDIDRFKEINDTFGHTAGDNVIVEAARRVSGALRVGSRVARIGGDEFAVLVSGVRDPNECAEIARRILQLFADPIDLGSSSTIVTMSIGIALCPHDARTMDSLVNSADLALYRAKNEGRNRFCFFEHRMGEEFKMRKRVEDELRIAISANQLIMEFQPIVSPDGRDLISVEALVRWQHPERGKISPASFITLAEESGLILPLGEWVMRRALTEARRWPGLRVAVNVSAIQFRQKDFVNTVRRLLQETGTAPTQLELELTESVLLADADQAEDAMMELRAMGVRLALDDFGTGYSSLIYLRRFAFDKIKIDKSFLESTESAGESAIIVHSIVHLGRALGLTVTAEGVETQDQHRFLQALGCHELQGFLFSPPMDASAIDARLGQPQFPMRSVA